MPASQIRRRSAAVAVPHLPMPNVEREGNAILASISKAEEGAQAPYHTESGALAASRVPRSRGVSAQPVRSLEFLVRPDSAARAPNNGGSSAAARRRHRARSTDMDAGMLGQDQVLTDAALDHKIVQMLSSDDSQRAGAAALAQVQQRRALRNEGDLEERLLLRPSVRTLVFDEQARNERQMREWNRERVALAVSLQAPPPPAPPSQPTSSSSDAKSAAGSDPAAAMQTSSEGSPRPGNDSGTPPGTPADDHAQDDLAMGNPRPPKLRGFASRPVQVELPEQLALPNDSFGFRRPRSAMAELMLSRKASVTPTAAVTPGPVVVAARGPAPLGSRPVPPQSQSPPVVTSGNRSPSPTRGRSTSPGGVGISMDASDLVGIPEEGSLSASWSLREQQRRTGSPTGAVMGEEKAGTFPAMAPTGHTLRECDRVALSPHRRRRHESTAQGTSVGPVFTLSGGAAGGGPQQHAPLPAVRKGLHNASVDATALLGREQALKRVALKQARATASEAVRARAETLRQRRRDSSSTSTDKPSLTLQGHQLHCAGEVRTVTPPRKTSPRTSSPQQIEPLQVLNARPGAGVPGAFIPAPAGSKRTTSPTRHSSRSPRRVSPRSLATDTNEAVSDRVDERVDFAPATREVHRRGSGGGSSGTALPPIHGAGISPRADRHRENPKTVPAPAASTRSPAAASSRRASLAVQVAVAGKPPAPTTPKAKSARAEPSVPATDGGVTTADDSGVHAALTTRSPSSVVGANASDRDTTRRNRLDPMYRRVKIRYERPTLPPLPDLEVTGSSAILPQLAPATFKSLAASIFDLSVAAPGGAAFDPAALRGTLGIQAIAGSPVADQWNCKVRGVSGDQIKALEALESAASRDQQAQAQQIMNQLRHALVIGVGEYTADARIVRDQQPAIDAAEIAAMLHGIGYHVTLLSTQLDHSDGANDMNVNKTTGASHVVIPKGLPTRENIVAEARATNKRAKQALSRYQQFLKMPGVALLLGKGLERDPLPVSLVIFLGAGYASSKSQIAGAKIQHVLLPADATLGSAFEYFTPGGGMAGAASSVVAPLTVDELSLATSDAHPAVTLPTDVGANTVYADCYSACRMLPCHAPEMNGFFAAAGAKYIGSDLFAAYNETQRLLGSFYLKRALSGYATRDSRLTTNSINSYIASKMSPFGAKCESSSSRHLVGDFVIAKANEMQYSRSDIIKIKELTHAQQATITVTLVPLRNQDPRTHHFTRELENALLKTLKVSARDEAAGMKCNGRVMTGRFAFIMSGRTETGKWVSDNAMRREHERRAAAELSQRHGSLSYNVAVNGTTAAGIATMNSRFAVNQFLGAVTATPETSSSVFRLALSNIAAPAAAPSNSGSPQWSTTHRSPGFNGASPFALSVAQPDTSADVDDFLSPPAASPVRSLQAAVNNAMTMRSPLLNPTTLTPNTTASRALRQKRQEDPCLADPVRAKMFLDNFQVHAVGVEVTLSFLTTDYMARKADRALRLGNTTRGAFLVSNVQVTPIDPATAHTAKLATKVQAAYRGWSQRRLWRPIMRVMISEKQARLGDFQEFRSELRAMQKQCFTEERHLLESFETEMRYQRGMDERADRWDIFDRVARGVTWIEATLRKRFEFAADLIYELEVEQEMYYRMTEIEGPRVAFMIFAKKAVKLMCRESYERGRIDYAMGDSHRKLVTHARAYGFI
jgi:hypothetical protein